MFYLLYGTRNAKSASPLIAAIAYQNADITLSSFGAFIPLGVILSLEYDFANIYCAFALLSIIADRFNLIL